MRPDVPQALEKGRVRTGEYASTAKDGLCGAFHVLGPHGLPLRIIADDNTTEPETSQGWEHVSVSTQYRTPTWQEMDYVKGLFWTDEEIVIQLHPPRKEWINNHPHCLHLWRYVLQPQPMPPSILVGVRPDQTVDPQTTEEPKTGGNGDDKQV